MGQCEELPASVFPFKGSGGARNWTGTLHTASDLSAFVAAQPAMVDCLAALAVLDLSDTWIGAGFVRNPVWDALHGQMPDIGTLADVDVVFFDPAHPEPEREQEAEAALALLHPGVPWSVRNQARMHRRNADPPYRDLSDALRHWLETATTVAVRLHKGQVEVLAPCGVADLLGLALRPTPATVAQPDKLAAYRCRVQAKGWLRRWPRLRYDEGPT